MEENEFKAEEEKLKEILEKYKQVLQYYNLRLEAIPNIYQKDPVMLENMLIMYNQKLQLMKKSIKKTIFCKIRFCKRWGKDSRKFIHWKSRCDG